jgi:hypothetical protein
MPTPKKHASHADRGAPASDANDLSAIDRGERSAAALTAGSGAGDALLAGPGSRFRAGRLPVGTAPFHQLIVGRMG